MDAATRWMPLGLGALATAVFALIAPPSFGWLDAAELSAAGAGLGSSHPTGFPLYMMWVRLATLIPIGEIAFRINLLSALSAGVCVAATARLVIEVGRSPLASLAGAVVSATALSSCLLFARHAVVAEVYVPSAAVFAIALLLLERAVRTGSARAGLSLTLVSALGLGLHPSLRLLIPVPLLVLWIVCLRRGARWPLFAPVVLVGVAAALQLYLPVRASTGRTAALDWGHPRTFGALVDHVSAARVRASFSEQIASTRAPLVSVNAHRAALQVFDGVGPVALLLGVLGLAWLASHRRLRWLAIVFCFAIGADFIYAFWINPMGLAGGQNGVFLATAVAVCAGLSSTWFLAKSGRAAPYLGGFVALLVALGPAWLTARELATASAAEPARRLADEAMNRLESRAIALVQSDSLAAATIFVTAIEGARPDVAILVRQHLHDIERTQAVTGLPGEPRTLEDLAKSGRPIAWEIGDDRVPVELGVEAGVPLASLGRAGTPSGDIVASAKRSRWLWSGALDNRESAHHLAATLTHLGRLAFGRGEIEMASNLFDTASKLSPEFASALINRGVVASTTNDLDRALELTTTALNLEPNRTTALINAARYAAALGKRDLARRHLRRAISLDPKNQRALSELQRIEALD